RVGWWSRHGSAPGGVSRVQSFVYDRIVVRACQPALAGLAALVAFAACAADDRVAVKCDVAAIRALRVDNRKEFAISSVRDETRRPSCGRVDAAVFANPNDDRDRTRVATVDRAYTPARGDLLAGIGL